MPVRQKSPVNVYGRAAVRAADLCREGFSPDTAWDKATMELCKSPTSQEKLCPRCAFLGLCEEGFVKGVKPGKYLERKKNLNKEYAVQALRVLLNVPAAANEVTDRPHLVKKLLWDQIAPKKAHNSQMDVVVGLWLEDLINK